MEIYFLKSSACLAILFVFYKLFLEKENMHVFKRFYLIGILLVSFSIPLITITSYIEISKHTPYINFTNLNQKEVVQLFSVLDYIPIFLWFIYLIGVLFFSFRFINNLVQILFKIKTNKHKKEATFIYVLLQEKTIPHTFFSYIFLGKQHYLTHKIPQEVLLHEQTHAIQKHSIDILFIEFLQIVLWFNPFIYFIKNSIKLNHEFLADQAVLKSGANTKNYQNILLAFSSKARMPIMANSINYSSFKKRFTVMKTHTSKTKIRLRSLFLFTLLAFLIYGFSTRIEVQKNKSNITTNYLQKKGATKAQLEAYNQLAKKYNAQAIENRIIKRKDIERLEFLYGLMTQTQKAKAEPFPECIPPPPSPPYPPRVSTSLLDQIIRMANENAAFLYKNNRISSDQAINLVKNKKNLRIETTFYKKSNPRVQIWNTDISTQEQYKNSLQKMEGDSGTININGKTFYFYYKNNTIKYYDKFGNEVDQNGKTK